ncbi:hypothetical protein RchiOBHm_Chr7g0236641 [Rosa chinensis]|uniref:Uncharacterized protein n=1 Tax=Rosa chinensis TaxID=74649 RepID=A0A2P6PH20_ROSCH|nr:hypothetical protein RchiOBHm_Chr7g0236641 [Rosa chinensis]
MEYTLLSVFVMKNLEQNPSLYSHKDINFLHQLGNLFLLVVGNYAFSFSVINKDYR